MTQVFLDTNVIVYANDVGSPRRKAIAVQLITELLDNGRGVVSSQVFQEFASVVHGKMHMPMELMLKQIAVLERFQVVLTDPVLVRRSLEMADRFQINFWDACILAAAERANCGVLLSEDLSAGQYYGTVKVENPFAE